jgi:hypothetical protein
MSSFLNVSNMQPLPSHFVPPDALDKQASGFNQELDHFMKDLSIDKQVHASVKIDISLVLDDIQVLVQQVQSLVLLSSDYALCIKKLVKKLKQLLDYADYLQDSLLKGRILDVLDRVDQLGSPLLTQHSQSISQLLD